MPVLGERFKLGAQGDRGTGAAAELADERCLDPAIWPLCLCAAGGQQGRQPISGVMLLIRELRVSVDRQRSLLQRWSQVVDGARNGGLQSVNIGHGSWHHHTASL